MPNTYTQLYVHIVFAVKGRPNLIGANWKTELFKYTSGIVKNKGQKLIAINGMPDHVHILIGLKPDKPLSDLVRDIKANSSRFINEKKWINGKFEWQTGFGAFSCSHSELPEVINYIELQETHHQAKTFREEYIALLKKYNVYYNENYLFDEM